MKLCKDRVGKKKKTKTAKKRKKSKLKSCEERTPEQKARCAGNNLFSLNLPSDFDNGGAKTLQCLGMLRLDPPAYLQRFFCSLSSAELKPLSETEGGREKKRGREPSAVGRGL